MIAVVIAVVLVAAAALWWYRRDSEKTAMTVPVAGTGSPAGDSMVTRMAADPNYTREVAGMKPEEVANRMCGEVFVDPTSIASCRSAIPPVQALALAASEMRNGATPQAAVKFLNAIPDAVNSITAIRPAAVAAAMQRARGDALKGNPNASVPPLCVPPTLQDEASYQTARAALTSAIKALDWVHSLRAQIPACPT